MTAFSRFKNAPDNPVCLDGVTNTEETKKDKEHSGMKGKRIETSKAPAQPLKQKKDDMKSTNKQSAHRKHSKGKDVEEGLKKSSLSGNKRKTAEKQKSEKTQTSRNVRTRSQSSEKMKGKAKACVNPSTNSDSDFEDPRITNVGIKINEPVVPGGRKKGQKKKGKENKDKPKRPVLGIRTRTSPMILQQTLYEMSDDQRKALLYVKSTVCEIEDLTAGVPPLQRWSMNHLRQKDIPIRQPRPEGIPSTSANPYDIDSVKKDIVMELNDMFAFLIRTKVEAKPVIERAKEIFPDEALFDRYEDELATLFNEEVLRGSSEIKKTTVHTQEECVGKTAQAKDESHPPSIHEGVRMCTPTKLDFDNADSLEA
ncbi:hypothetical protein L6452_32840 [Arctium lappa]|uniref:Uncharacterized protein n=1 Tax=Arctium lappa TaxID=4217 RepID=A0ACB8Z5Y0_ARCLA|nr:hypothetical protein L6452_32840 [Arctium lappa]